MKLEFIFKLYITQKILFVESRCWGPNLDQTALGADVGGIMWWGPMFKGNGARLVFWNKFRSINLRKKLALLGASFGPGNFWGQIVNIMLGVNLEQMPGANI